MIDPAQYTIKNKAKANIDLASVTNDENDLENTQFKLVLMKMHNGLVNVR
jgi:hypothetical protein